MHRVPRDRRNDRSRERNSHDSRDRRDGHSREHTCRHPSDSHDGHSGERNSRETRDRHDGYYRERTHRPPRDRGNDTGAVPEKDEPGTPEKEAIANTVVDATSTPGSGRAGTSPGNEQLVRDHVGLANTCDG